MKLHRIFPSLFVGACLFSGAIVVQAQPPEAPPEPPPVVHNEEPEAVVDNESPGSTIEVFIELYKRNRWHELPDLITGAENDAPALAKIVEEIVKARGTLELRVADIAVEMVGDEATAVLTVHDVDHLGMGVAWREKLRLHREHAGQREVWKLRPSEFRVIYSSAFDSYLQRLITLIAYPGKTLVLQSQRQSAMQVRQLALGVKQFVQDNDEQYAFTPETVREQIKLYLRDEAVWTAPGDVAGTVSYSFNPHLANVNEANIKFVSETVLFYLGRDEKLDFRYDGKTVVGFADGHVELLNEEGTKKLRWKP